MDLGGWLRSLGLGQYEGAFLEHAIDDTVLPNLTAEDLRDLGVGIVGHRRLNRQGQGTDPGFGGDQVAAALIAASNGL
jgi:hypothetical protein